MPNNVSLESDKPFFSRTRTKAALANLAHSATFDRKPLTIYAGAGVTIDRSGLGWSGMIDGLLEKYVDGQEARKAIFDSNNLEAAATLTEGFYQRDYGDDHFRDRMIDRLRWMLYAPGDWQAGRLVDEIAQLCNALKGHGSGFLVATPNYDDYIAQSLQDAGFSVNYLRSTDGGSPLLKSTTRCRSASWTNAPAELNRLFAGSESVLHLHGLIPRDPTRETLAPVISELDYIESAPYTFRALRSLLSSSGLLMVGTSMTDGPLLQALEKTKELGFPRYAIVPLGLGKKGSRQERQKLREHQIERFARFGVTPIYVDYHFQVAQFVAELSRLIERVDRVNQHPDESVITGLVTQDSYGKRLMQWSEDWKGSLDQVMNLGGQSLRIEDLYNNLQDSILDEIHESLDLSASEVVKLEIWVRDMPNSHRGLRLWSSTVSRHFQEASARRADFSNDSEIAAVRAFAEGRPTVYNQSPDIFPSARWHTYFAAPIWLGAREASYYGSLPVGAVVVASRRVVDLDGSNPGHRGRLVRVKRRESMKQATRLMTWLGQTVTSTTVAIRAENEGDRD